MEQHQTLIGQLQGFLPGEFFDIHAHLYRACDAIDSLPKHVANSDGNVGWHQWHTSLSAWTGEHAPKAGLFFAFPHPKANPELANQFVLNETKEREQSRALLLIRPKDDPSLIEKQILDNKTVVAGFKVYHVYADRKNTQQAEIGEFLPEWAWELANRYELILMLHIVRSRALADQKNQEYIRRQCKSYPQARLMLAHAARGFCASHTVEGVRSLRGLDNVYFDTSAVCESPAMEAILREFGPTRLLFGTDFPISEMVGRCISVGDCFFWLGEQHLKSDGDSAAAPTLVGIESLLALRTACQNARLSDGDVEMVFRENAEQLLNLDRTKAPSDIQETYRKAKRLIPGGTQLLSKRPEMYAPDRWPAYFREARGCRVIDIEGKEYCDMTTSGIGSCLLGYSDPDVNDAVIRRVQLGSMSTLNAVEEYKLADLLLAIHPWAEQARFARTGGEALSIAIRIARTATSRDVVAFCGYHGWSDWYLAANLPEEKDSNEKGLNRLEGHLLSGLSPSGVPSCLAGSAVPFTYNHLDELENIVGQNEGKIAAVVMEPFRTIEPEAGFLQGVRNLCDRIGAVLILDEITSGWRFGLGGIHLQLDVEPDMAVFAKAISNGFPMAAVLGKRAVMDAAQRSFISSTYWTEAIGPTAAIATIEKMLRENVSAHVSEVGKQFRGSFLDLAGLHNIDMRILGRDPLLNISFDHPGSTALGTLFTIRMLERGFLAGSGFYPSFAHHEQHLSRFFQHADVVLGSLAQSIKNDSVQEQLQSEQRHTGFARLA